MKGLFKAVWHQSARRIVPGKESEKDNVELTIEIEDVTPENMKKLAASLSEFQVEWL